MPPGQDIPDVAVKRKMMRAVAAAAAACALVLAAGLAVHASNLAKVDAETLSAQSASEAPASSADSGKTSDKRLVVPALTSFLGSDQDAVVEALGEGATLVSSRSVDSSGSAVRTVSSIALTNESADSSAGTPTVTLALDEEGAVIQAGYTANIRLLGYGSVSFIDAAENMHVIENTLREGGLDVPDGSVEVPEAKADYAVYGADGITLAKEQYAFSGTVSQGGASYGWRGELSYDYTQANAQGNLAYTVRLVTVTVIAAR